MRLSDREYPLLAYVARVVPWAPLCAALLPALGVAWFGASAPHVAQDGAVAALRLAGLCLALGIAFVLDDPTEDTTAHAPVSILARRALKLALALPPAVVAWFALRFMVASLAGLEVMLPLGSLLLEFLALAAIGLAAAAVMMRNLSDHAGGRGGAGALVVVYAALAVVPWPLRILGMMPGSPAYVEVGDLVPTVTLAMAALFVQLSRTPGWRPRLIRRTDALRPRM